MISSEHRARRRRPSAARRNRCATSKKGEADDVSRRALPRHRTGRGPQRRASARLWASPAPPPPFGHPVLHVGAPHLPRPRAPLRAGRRFDARDARLVGPQRERRAAPFRRRSAHAAPGFAGAAGHRGRLRARRHRDRTVRLRLRRTRELPLRHQPAGREPEHAAERLGKGRCAPAATRPTPSGRNAPTAPPPWERWVPRLPAWPWRTSP